VKKLRHVTRGYSVVFVHGTCNFALSEYGVAGRAFFMKHREAVTFKRELLKHRMRTRVVKAVATLETM